MKVVVIGGTGLIGKKVVTNLRQHGQEAVAASPSSGVNTVTGEGLAQVLAGVGVGLLLGAALVELEVLTSQRKAWASLLGAVLVGVGGLVGWRGQSGNRGGAEPGAAPDRGPR